MCIGKFDSTYGGSGGVEILCDCVYEGSKRSAWAKWEFKMFKIEVAEKSLEGVGDPKS